MDNIHDISSYKPCKNSKNYSVKELWHTPHALTLLFFGLNDDAVKYVAESIRNFGFIEELKTIIARTKDGMHKKDLIRQLKRLYRKNRLMKRGSK